MRNKENTYQPLGPVIHEVWGNKTKQNRFERALAKNSIFKHQSYFIRPTN